MRGGEDCLEALIVLFHRHALIYCAFYRVGEASGPIVCGELSLLIARHNRKAARLDV